MFEKVSSIYKQCKGTAMGSKMSPNFSSLYVASFENEFVLNQRNPFYFNIKLWRRYVDDIFVIFEGSIQSLMDFYNYLNSSHQHLKFSLNHSVSAISFLDIMIRREDNRLITDLYRKETDKCSFLHANSFHPPHMKKSLPISQFNRVKRICTKQMDYVKQADELEHRFRMRGYREEWVKGARDRFDASTQEECLQNRKDRPCKNAPRCYLKFSSIGKDIENILRKYWHVVNTDPHLKNTFKDLPQVVYKRPPNLRQMLVRSDLVPPKKRSFFGSSTWKLQMWILHTVQFYIQM